MVTRLLSRDEYEQDLSRQIAAARKAMRGLGGGALSPGGGQLDLGRAAALHERLLRQLQVFQK